MPSNREILEKAIQKAIDGGWDGFDMNAPYPICRYIFNHDFAKALWGIGDRRYAGDPDWVAHLKRMVIADDPIKYLGENI